MAGIIVKSPLKPGASIVGRVDEVFETTVLLELHDGAKVKLPLPKEVLETINDDHNNMFGGDIIQITRTGDEYSVEELEEFPSNEKKKD